VFDVEMDSGAKLKLALDGGENPYIVADRFLEQNDLPAEFKEQVRLVAKGWCCSLDGLADGVEAVC
jgi:hypothetical protein